MDDKKIVELFLERSETAIDLCSLKYGEKLKRIALNVCSDAGVAEECLNDALLAAWDSIPPNEPGDYLFAYLAKIVRAKALNRVRANSAVKRSAELVALTEELQSCIPSGESSEAAAEGAELSRAVSTFLKGLPEEKRRLFIRRYWYMDPIRDIAERFSLREGKVKSVLFRTRNELKEYLKKEGYIQ